MLVLSRKAFEQIKFSNGVTIQVNRIVGNRVHIGIEAPPEVRIVRGELKPHEQQKPEGEEGRAA